MPASVQAWNSPLTWASVVWTWGQPQGKCSPRSRSCRCGAHPLWFSGTRDFQSGWCWCFSGASVSTPALLRTPAEPWSLRAKTSVRSLAGIRATTSFWRAHEWVDASFSGVKMWKRGTYSLAIGRREPLDGTAELLRAQLLVCDLKKTANRQEHHISVFPEKILWLDSLTQAR